MVVVDRLWSLWTDYSRCALSLVCIWDMSSEKRKRVGLSYGRRNRTYEEKERVIFFFFFI